MGDTETTVGKWLAVNGAEKYTKAFFDGGYKELLDIPRDAIAALVSDGALAKKLADSFDQWTDPGLEDPPPTAWSGSLESAPPAKLPARAVLDLSQPTVKAPDVPEFTIPSVMRVNADNTEIIYPSDLTQVDWLVIARKTKILYAYAMGAVAKEPPQAGSAALDWMVPESATDYFDSLELTGRVNSEVAFTDETASYVRAGFDKQEASVGIPFASASFEREHKERRAAASHKKTLHLFGRWYYPRVRLKLKYCATASERFKTAVRTALDSYDRTKNINLLLNVFEQYGTAIPSEVILGGEMLLEHQENYQGEVNEKQVENVISAAVSIKTQKASGSVGFSFQNAEGSTVTSDQMSKTIDFSVRGGDSTKTSDPQSWPATVKPAKNWEVIGREKLTSIVDWLPEDLRRRLMVAWPRVPVPPAIWDAEEIRAENHSAKAASDTFVFGVRSLWKGVGLDPRGARGGLEIVCGDSGSPVLGQPDAVGAGPTFHAWHSGDIWLDGASICLPVPKGAHFSFRKWDDYRDEGEAPSRLAKAETGLGFSKWRLLWEEVVPHDPHFPRANLKAVGTATPVSAQFRGYDMQLDSFVFFSVQAPADGDRGSIWLETGGRIVGAASVHNRTPDSGASSPHACLCAPVARGGRTVLNVTPSSGKLAVKAWLLQCGSPAWKFGKPQPYAADLFHTAENDGFLNGVVAAREGDLEGNARAKLLLYCGKDRASVMEWMPPAVIAAHRTTNRHIPFASAMLPIRKGFVFRAVPQDVSADSGHKATVEAYWTPVEAVV
jgi:hypothetical protein